MPYIITTKRFTPSGRRTVPGGAEIMLSDTTRRAVATLDEARDYVHRAGATFSVAAISEIGGTVGPLPDGTVIEVRHAPLNSPFGNAAAWCDIYNRHHAIS